MTDPKPDYAVARKAMIDSQLRTSGVNAEYVLARMSKVAREDFVPESQRALAYIDRAVPLGEGQFLAAPVVQGMMLTEAAPKQADRALVVGDSSGYFAELIRPLVGGLETMTAVEAAGGRDSNDSNYSLIVIDGAVEGLSERLEHSLEEGGRVVSGIVDNGITRLAVGRKVAGQISFQSLADLGIPVLHSFDTPKSWSFA